MLEGTCLPVDLDPENNLPYFMEGHKLSPGVSIVLAKLAASSWDQRHGLRKNPALLDQLWDQSGRKR
jgi:hypothetical protein